MPVDLANVLPRFVALSLAAMVVAACTATPDAAPSDGPPSSEGSSAPPSAQPTEPTEPAAPGLPPDADVQAAIVAAVRAATPEGWSLEFDARFTTDDAVEGIVDDGGGPGRIFVHATQTPGNQQLRPCADPDFNQGAICTTTEREDGSILSVRGLVDFEGLRSVQVTLTRPDGTGAGAEAGNYVPTGRPAGRFARKPDGPSLQRSRNDPVYDLEQLTDVVIAVAEATR